MSKTRKDNRGNTREQRLQHENIKLKKQISQLRKQLARVDLDRYTTVRDIIEQHYQDDRLQEGADLLEKLKEEWKCRECTEGYLEIHLYNKVDTTYYYRRCTCCNHRTKSQKYDPVQVKGIIKKDD